MQYVGNNNKGGGWKLRKDKRGETKAEQKQMFLQCPLGRDKGN